MINEEMNGIFLKRIIIFFVSCVVVFGGVTNEVIETTNVYVENTDLLRTKELTICDSNKYKMYCGEHEFAYITDRESVYYVCDYGNGQVHGCEIEGISKARAIWGYANHLFILDGGEIKLYDIGNEVFIPISGDLQYEYYYELMNFMEQYNGKIEDIYIQIPNFIMIKSQGEWICSDENQDIVVDWNNVVQINGQGAFPELVLMNDGSVVGNINGNSGLNLDMIQQINEWKNVKKVALGVVPFALLENGTVITTKYTEAYASDVKTWKNMKDILADLYVTVGLQENGKVKVCSPMNRSFYIAESWKNICYISITPYYLCGVNEDGKILFTDYKGIDDISLYLQNGDCPNLCRELFMKP